MQVRKFLAEFDDAIRSGLTVEVHIGMKDRNAVTRILCAVIPYVLYDTGAVTISWTDGMGPLYRRLHIGQYYRSNALLNGYYEAEKRARAHYYAMPADGKPADGKPDRSPISPTVSLVTSRATRTLAVIIANPSDMEGAALLLNQRRNSKVAVACIGTDVRPLATENGVFVNHTPTRDMDDGHRWFYQTFSGLYRRLYKA
jgi:hypothetical protein